MGLLIVVIFKQLGMSGMMIFTDKAIFVPFPSLFGFNMKTLSVFTN
jgi:hypothetical protein